MVHVWKSHTGEDEACTLLQIQTQSVLQSKTLFQTNKAQGKKIKKKEAQEEEEKGEGKEMQP